MVILGMATKLDDLYPSAEMVARRSEGSESTWLRLVAQLRAMGLVTTARLNRPNGQQSVNLLDIYELWRWLLDFLNAPKKRRKRPVITELIGTTLWIKEGAFWEAIPLKGGARGGN